MSVTATVTLKRQRTTEPVGIKTKYRKLQDGDPKNFVYVLLELCKTEAIVRFDNIYAYDEERIDRFRSTPRAFKDVEVCGNCAVNFQGFVKRKEALEKGYLVFK